MTLRLYYALTGKYALFILAIQLPPPSIPTHVLQTELGAPPQQLCSQRRIGKATGHVAGAPRVDLVGHFDLVDPLKGVDQLQHADALPGAQVDGEALARCCKVVERSQVPLGQVHHVNVVSNPGAVGCGVVDAEHVQAVSQAGRHLGDVGHEVVGRAVGLLPQLATGVSAHGVEVAQDGHLPTWVSRLHVTQHVFGHEFGAAVGVGDPQGAAFHNGHVIGVAVDGGGRAEHQAPHTGLFHGLEQGHVATQVVVKVPQGLGHRFAHGFQAGKVHHARKMVFGEQALEQGAVSRIAFYKRQLLWEQGANMFNGVGLAVAQVVQHHHRMTCRAQLQRGVRTDVAGAASDENVGLHGCYFIRRHLQVIANWPLLM